MKVRRQLLAGALLVLAAAGLAPPARTVVPDSLTDEQFWKLSAELSEPGGTFRSENLLSNERGMQQVIPDLTKAVSLGRVYLGVGPEQNFTYIAAVRPSMAFIVDIRRGNLQLHLMYKALFELAADRTEFVSRLFSRKRPPDVPATASAEDLFNAFAASDGNDDIFTANLAAIREQLSKTHKFSLQEEDWLGLQWIYQSFYASGPSIQYSANFGRNGGFATYAELMTATDAAGVPRSYLASPESFTFIKTLHARNLIVPVVGDFAGAKALRAVGSYLKEREGTVGVFYLSNVEQYLEREGRWPLFCENVATLPLDDTSTFIRSVRDGNYLRPMELTSVTGKMLAETKSCPKP
jgi:hypothetical protein